MTAEATETKGAETSAENGMPTDFYVGVTLLCVAFFIFVLSAAGALGDGKHAAKGGHGAASQGSHGAGKADAGKGHGEKGGPGEKEAGRMGESRERKTEQVVAETPEGEPVYLHLRAEAELIDPAKTKVVLLPCAVKTTYEYGMSLEKVSAILTEACAKVFGESAVSLAKIEDRLSRGKFEGLSRRLATGAFRALRYSKSFELSADRFVAESRELPGLVREAVDLARREKLVPADVRYVFALTVVGMGPGEGNKKKVLVTACFFDLESKRVHSCIYYPEVLPAEKLPMQRRFAAVPGEALDWLMAKAGKGH